MKLLRALLCLCLASLATAGTLRTRDGRTLEGLITLDPAGGALLVTSGEGQPVKIPLSEVALATFEPYAPEATNSLIPADKVGSGNGLLGTYFKHSDFAGRTVHRLDETINFDWGTAAPIATIHHDYFSIRWTGQVEVPAPGEYTFYIQTDDGGRLWVNNQLLADNWRSPETPEASGSITLEPGKKYDLKYEYFENYGNARARLLWSGPGITKSVIPRSQLHASSPLGLYSDVLRLTNGLLATYYNDGDLSSSTTFVRVDPTVDLSWKGKAPATGLDSKSFSVRWSGLVRPLKSETHTFHVVADGGVRLWLNDEAVIDDWDKHTPAERSGKFDLLAGTSCDLRLEFAAHGDKPAVKLSWSSPTMAKAVIPASQLLPSKPTDPSNPTLRPVPGLMGTYFSKPDLTGEPLKRVDANIAFEWGGDSPLVGIPADNFSVRWAGRLKPQFNESHTFQVIADDGARLWLDGKLIVDAWRELSGTNNSAPVALSAGRSYDIVMEYFEATKTATAKLLWSSPSTPLQVIPSSQFSPPSPPRAATSLAETRKSFPKGVLTWSGSFLATPVKQADDTAITFTDPFKGRRLSTINAAFIALQPISTQRLIKMPTTREGLLLATGDFVDGEFKGIEDGKVKLSSVLFGLKTFDASYEVLAIVLRAPASPPQDLFEVQSRDGSVILAKAPKLEDGALVLAEPPLAGLRVREQDLLEIRFGRATNLFQLLLDKAESDSKRRYTDDGTRRALEAEEAALAKAAAEAVVRGRNDAEMKARADVKARADFEERERIRAALERKAKTVAEKAAADDAALARAQNEKDTADRVAAVAKTANEQAAAVLAEKTKLTADARLALDKAFSNHSGLARVAADARANADRVASRTGSEKNVAEQSFANTKATVDRLATEAAARSRAATETRVAADKLAARAVTEKAAAEAAWMNAKAAVDKAAAEIAAKMKLLAEVKAVAEKSAAEAAALVGKPGKEKELADATAKAKLTAEARSSAQESFNKAVAAKPALDAAANNAKANFDRVNSDTANKLKLAAQAQAAADKATADAKAAADKAVAEKSTAEAKATATKAAAEKGAAEAVAKSKAATAARLEAEKALADAQNVYNKVTAEKSAAQTMATSAKSAYDRAAGDAATKSRLASSAKSAAERSAAEKSAVDKALEDATAATRAEPQRKVRLE